MLKNSFCHVDGLGGHTERELWRQGCHNWDCFLENPMIYSMNSMVRELAIDELTKSKEALTDRNHHYFARKFSARENWRTWPEFRSSTVYLDIETNGTAYDDNITTIGLYDGKEFTCLIQGQDLGNFPDIISRYSTIVTFFGSGFDLPVLQKTFPTVAFDHIHIDLCLGLKKVGHRGGLKRIERECGIMRSEETAGLTGRDAIFLWSRYLRGDDAALETLIAYNREDVVNLEKLAQIAYDKLKANTFYEAGLTVRNYSLFS